MSDARTELEARSIGSIDIPVVGMGTSGTFEVDDHEIGLRAAIVAAVGTRLGCDPDDMGRRRGSVS